MKYIFLWLYLLTGMAHLIFVAGQNTGPEMATKYLLMPLLMAHVFRYERKNLMQQIHLFLALLFCWFGDILLLYTHNNENFFLFGLAAFLIGHIFYMFAFARSARKAGSLLKRKPILFLIPVAYAVSLFVIIQPYLGDFLIPVLLYAIVITIMLMVAMNRHQRTNVFSYYLTLIGAVLFILSDSTIAINKFRHAFTAASLIIMSTYILAQYLIVVGLLLHAPSDDVD